MEKNNPLYQGIQMGMEKSKDVLEITLSKLRDLQDNAENLVFVENSVVHDFTSEISSLIGFIESHIEEEFGEDEAADMGISVGLLSYDEDDE